MCGIIGIIGNEPVTEELFGGMMQIQHRGQDASGLYLYSPASKTGYLRKMRGPVPELFKDGAPFRLKKEWRLGHVRYSTAGSGGLDNAQPLLLEKLALIHNGNLVNYLGLRDRLQEAGCRFETSSESEALLHLLANSLETASFDAICGAVERVFAQTQGSYSVIAMYLKQGVFAFRDPEGIRLLLMGSKPSCFGFASESPALSVLGFQNIRDLKPGEVVFIDSKLTLHQRSLTRKRQAFCSFEFNYFAKPHSVMEGKEIYKIRARLGSCLAKKAKKAKFCIDAVVPVPESGNVAAIALAQALPAKFEAGFIKMNHVGRTFLFGSQEKRKKAVSQKLFPVASVFKDKSVLLVDDSIIRGTVSTKAIALARCAGAKKVFFASTFPPVRYPCVYGIDFPKREGLIASSKSIEETCLHLGADDLIYNDIEDLKQSIGLKTLCLACLTGDYPTPVHEMEKMQKQREKDLLLVE